SAQERYEPKDKWNKFTHEVDTHAHRKKYSQRLVNHLDETKQWAALHYAVFNNNTYVSDKLTDKKNGEKHFHCDINILTGNGENVLHVATRSNFLWEDSPLLAKSKETTVEIDHQQILLPSIICTLIDRGTDVNHPDDEGRTPLHLAIMENRLTFVKYLLHRNANIYATTKLYSNVLHFTFIPNGQTSSQLSDMYQYITTKLDQSTSTQLFPWRVKRKNLPLMRTFDNRTPLILAVSHPAITDNIIRNLLTQMGYYSADIFNQSLLQKNIYQTQIFMAIAQVAKQRRLPPYDHLKLILDVCDHNILNQLFHFPCRYNNANLLKWLIEQSSKPYDPSTRSRGTSIKLDLNKHDHAGYTPLLTAVFYGSTDCVNYLLDTSSLSVKIDEVNADGENILHICAKHPVSKHLFKKLWNLPEKLKLLEQQDSNGNLPLHVAAANNQMEMCEAFLTAFNGATQLLRKKNIQGQTAAHMATEAVPHRTGPERHYIDKHEKDKYHDSKTNQEENDDEHNFGLPTLQKMWDITSTEGREEGLFRRDDDRKTCLHLAAANGHEKIVKFLVEIVRLEVDCIADRRVTPLHLACENGHGEVVAYLIEHGASTTFRNADLYNSLEIAIINQNKKTVEELLTLPNWRELMRNAQRIHNSEGYDTPMRKLIRYMPDVAIWMIEENLSREIGGQGKHVFKKVYDYEFYMDIYRVKQWLTQGTRSTDEEESCAQRCRRRDCSTVCCWDCCCQSKLSEEKSNQIPYTNDAYTLIRNHPLFIASEQSQCPDLVQHPYNTFLRDQWYSQNSRLFYLVRAVSFILYAAFLAIWTAIILLGNHPQYFFNKLGRTMTLDLDSCETISRNLTTASDTEALKTTAYKTLQTILYGFLLFFVVENSILIFALFPRIFRTIDYILEISAFVLTFVYVYDWRDWQSPVVFRCPVQYQIGSMGLLLSWLGLLSYVKRTTWFDMGVFVVMIQLIGFKFIRFIPVLLIIVCGFGFTHWMLLSNQSPFQTPIGAVIRTSLLMFDLGYEDHLYNNQIYYQIIFFITILSAIVFCIFILNLLISVAVGEIPSLTVQGKIWQTQMLYDLLSDYSIVSLQLIRLINCISCGAFGRWLLKQRIQPIFILEHDQKGTWYENAWKYVKKNFFDEKIQDDIIPIKSSDDTQKDQKER
ncbi:unnamed protein product, partial [Rotaria sp. Silwood1]